jgi:hypothetical protein
MTGTDEKRSGSAWLLVACMTVAAAGGAGYVLLARGGKAPVLEVAMTPDSREARPGAVEANNGGRGQVGHLAPGPTHVPGPGDPARAPAKPHRQAEKRFARAFAALEERLASEGVDSKWAPWATAEIEREFRTALGEKGAPRDVICGKTVCSVDLIFEWIEQRERALSELPLPWGRVGGVSAGRRSSAAGPGADRPRTVDARARRERLSRQCQRS